MKNRENRHKIRLKNYIAFGIFKYFKQIFFISLVKLLWNVIYMKNCVFVGSFTRFFFFIFCVKYKNRKKKCYEQIIQGVSRNNCIHILLIIYFDYF